MGRKRKDKTSIIRVRTSWYQDKQLKAKSRGLSIPDYLSLDDVSRNLKKGGTL